jgi:hypothetical protein
MAVTTRKSDYLDNNVKPKTGKSKTVNNRLIIKQYQAGIELILHKTGQILYPYCNRKIIQGIQHT